MTIPPRTWKPKGREAGIAFSSASAPPMGPKLPDIVIRRHRPLGGTQGSNKTWLVSFTDIMGLMLTFFVLLYAMSERQPQDASATDGALPGQYEKTFDSAPLSMGDSDVISLPRKRHERGLDVAYLRQILDGRKEKVPALGVMTVQKIGSDVVISLPLEVVVHPKTDGVDDALAQELVGILGSVPNRVELEIGPLPAAETGQGFTVARKIVAKIRAKGYARPLNFLVNTGRSGAGPMVNMRITPFVQDKTE